MEVLVLSEKEIADLLSIEEVMKVVENAFREKALGHVQMPAKVYLNFSKYNGDLRAMPAYLERLDVASVKIVNSHPENPKKYCMPTVLATVLLLDPKNGALLSIMGGKKITAIRTAAAGGIAIKYLAKREIKTVSFIGTGVQARAQLLALLAVRQNIEEIKVCDILPEAAKSFVHEAAKITPKSKIIISENERIATKDADIIITTTPSKKPLIFESMISEGVHFNCIGADAPLKEEIDSAILKKAKIVVDDWEQASHSGEINVPLSKDILSKKDVWAELGEILIGKKHGRTSNQEITIFDSTGLAIQDAATVQLVYKKAKNKKIGNYIEI